MKNTVVVKKNINQRYGIRFLAFLCAIATLVTLRSSGNSLSIVLLCILIDILFLMVLLHFETWKITFSSDRITGRSFFREVGPYSYAQISDAVMAHSHTLNGHIRITFCNSKTLQFRLEDENADKATEIMCKHCSIRTLL